MGLFTGLKLFWKGIPGWGQKAIIYAVLAAVVLYLVRLYGNHIYDRGFERGRVSATADIEKRKAAEWKAKEAELAKEAAGLAEERKTFDAERKAFSSQQAELQRARQTIRDELARGLAQAQANREQIDARVTAVPATQLDGALRALSGKLAASH